MNRYLTRAEVERRKRNRLRMMGYEDGLLGLPARSAMREYQVSYRRGAESRRMAEAERGKPV